jgi:hypothetical protein
MLDKYNRESKLRSGISLFIDYSLELEQRPCPLCGDRMNAEKKLVRAQRTAGTHRLEALLFYCFYMKEVAGYPPDNFDQASELIETHGLQEPIFIHGLGQVWKSFLSRGHAATALFPRALWEVFLLVGRRCRNFVCSFLDSVDFRLPSSRRPGPFGSVASTDTSPWGSRHLGWIHQPRIVN